MKVLVLDLVHGGKVLAEEYLKRGDEVTATDVYHVTPRDILGDLKHKGARVMLDPPAEHFDLLVQPCHCADALIGPASYDRRIWYSEAVGEFIRDRRFRVEITGVKGKTSTAYILAHILSEQGKSVYLHCSRGMGPYAKGKHFITEYKSIAPPMLLTMPKGEYDVMVCEVSLGGSGKADIAAITNLVGNPGIAKNTRTSEDAKKYVLTDRGVNIVAEEEQGIWSKYGKPLRTYGHRVIPIGKPVFGEPLKVSVEYRGKHEATLRADYLALQYLRSFDLALEICDAMDVPAEAVIAAMESFPGVPGRGEVSVKDGVRYLKDRNPGISHMSIDYLLSCLKQMDVLGNAVIMMDPVNRKVCDKLDKDEIGEVCARYGVPIVLTQPGEEQKVPEGKDTVICMVKEGYQ